MKEDVWGNPNIKIFITLRPWFISSVVEAYVDFIKFFLVLRLRSGNLKNLSLKTHKHRSQNSVEIHNITN